MTDLFARDYRGEPFVLFGIPHLAALALLLALNLWFRTLRDGGEEQRRRVRTVMALALLVNELGWHLWNWSVGLWTLQTMLPLHLCSILVFVSAVMLSTRSYRIYEVCYFLGIAGAVQALLTPDLGIYGFPHYRYWQSFTSHGLIASAAVYMTVAEGYRPTWGSLWRALLIGHLAMPPVYAVNMLLGSAYMYLGRKPATPSVLDLFGPWPWYFLAMEALALLSCLLLYAPFALRDRLALGRQPA